MVHPRLEGMERLRGDGKIIRDDDDCRDFSPHKGSGRKGKAHISRMHKQDHKEEGKSLKPSVSSQETEQDAPLYVGIIDQKGQIRSLKSLADHQTLAALQHVIEPLPEATFPVPEKKSKRQQRLPAMTSGHVTHFPGTQEFLTLTGSFGTQAAQTP